MLKLVLLSALAAVSFGGRVPSVPRNAEEYITNGTEIDISEAPYQVAVFEKGRFVCGGVILTSTIVATSYSCSHFYSAKYLKIRAGSSIYDRGGVTVAAKDFLFETKNYIIAVIKLESPLTFSNKIQPIKIAKAEPPPNTEVTLSGWGMIKEGNSEKPSSTLRSVKVRTISFQACYDRYYPYIYSCMFCTYMENKDASFRDNGGPVVAGGKLVGIVYGSYKWGAKDFPLIHINIADYDVYNFLEPFLEE